MGRLARRLFRKNVIFDTPPALADSPVLSPQTVSDIEKAAGRDSVETAFTLAVWAGTLYRFNP
jgi:hypothetical protein